MQLHGVQLGPFMNLIRVRHVPDPFEVRYEMKGG